MIGRKKRPFVLMNKGALLQAMFACLNALDVCDDRWAKTV